MNLSSIIRKGSRYFSDKKALIFEDTSFSYDELNACVDQAAFYLKQHGISKGDRVALYLNNRPEWIILYYAIIRLGAAAVCMSASYRSTELEYLINDSQPALIITSEDLRPYFPKGDKTPPTMEVLLLEENKTLMSIFEKKGKEVRSPITEDCEADDMCVILNTGGTTGTPKGAMLTHKNLLYTAQNVCYHEKIVPNDTGLCFMPLDHVFAGNHIMNSTFYGGATLVLHKGFDMDDILSSLDKNAVTRFYAIPTVYIRLLNNQEGRKYLRSLGYCFSAAASMPSEIVRQWKKTFGLDIHEAYGMTETSSLVTFNHLYRHKVGSVGTPAGVVEVKLVDDTGKEIKQGEDGEITIRGPNIMKGYFNKPEETVEAMPDGWLYSGDMGRLDEEGYLYIVDRKKDVIISGGLNIFPTEVEEILYSHPSVEECGVVGIPHEEYGEAVAAFVRLKEGQTVSGEDLIRFCKDKIATYKVPKNITFVEDFRKSPQGKILKRKLRKF